VNWNSPNATGVTVTTSYSTPGTYTVTLQASDAAGLTATDTALITVSETPATLTAYVNIDLSKQVVSKWWRVTAIATVTKDTSGPVIADATVEGTWGEVYTGTVSGTTDANGKVSFKTGFIRNTGTVTFKVTKVIKDTQEYTLAGETNKSISN
jgi:PKD repeat protein